MPEIHFCLVVIWVSALPPILDLGFRKMVRERKKSVASCLTYERLTGCRHLWIEYNQPRSGERCVFRLFMCMVSLRVECYPGRGTVEQDPEYMRVGQRPSGSHEPGKSYLQHSPRVRGTRSDVGTAREPINRSSCRHAGCGPTTRTWQASIDDWWSAKKSLPPRAGGRQDQRRLLMVTPPNDDGPKSNMGPTKGCTMYSVSVSDYFRRIC